jgi:hypothetical protein
MGMLWSAGNQYMHSSERPVHVYVYDLTGTHFQQKGPQTKIQGLILGIVPNQ